MIYFFVYKYKFLIGIFIGIIIICLLVNNNTNIQLDKFALGDNNISGSGKADESSLITAIKMASLLSQK